MDDVIIINAELVNNALNQDKQHIINIVRDTYLSYQKGDGINPDCFILRFPEYIHRRFINGTITLDARKPTLFSPFGMGILDLNVAKYVYDSIRRDQLGLRCGFYL